MKNQEIDTPQKLIWALIKIVFVLGGLAVLLIGKTAATVIWIILLIALVLIPVISEVKGFEEAKEQGRIKSSDIKIVFGCLLGVLIFIAVVISITVFIAKKYLI